MTPNSFNFDRGYRASREDELVPTAMSLFRDTDIRVQHEGLELLHVLLLAPRLQVICAELLSQTN